jgi:glycosyltransferase involved in cell wall biosynthesis
MVTPRTTVSRKSARAVATPDDVVQPAEVLHDAAVPGQRIAVVIPCYRVSRQVLGVIARVGPECSGIYAIDDACPENSGDAIESECADPRVWVLRHRRNMGVGAAVLSGYRAALQDGADVIVKIDGDGQMAPELLPGFVAPILGGQADYCKGNRFYELDNIDRMPLVRKVGNAALSFMTKLSGGYWDIFDPANGYTAIHASVARRLPFDKISERYFFESDMLFRLNTIRAVVVDIPMDATYGDETSSLKVFRIFPEFFYKNLRNGLKRTFYNYFLRDFSIASLELVVGLAMLAFGTIYGSVHWIASAHAGVATPPGTVMLAALPVLVGVQLLIAFVGYDIASVPKRAIHPALVIREQAQMRESAPPESDAR